MSQKVPIIKIFLMHGKMYCHVVENYKDITDTVSKITLIVDRGRVISGSVEKAAKHNDEFQDRS